MSIGPKPEVGDYIKISRYDNSKVTWLAKVLEINAPNHYFGVLIHGRHGGYASKLSLVYGKRDYDEFCVVSPDSLSTEELVAIGVYELTGETTWVN